MDRTTKVALCCLLGLALVPGKTETFRRLYYQHHSYQSGAFSVVKTIEATSFNNTDITWATSGVIQWTTLEICSGLIVACLPTLWMPCVAVTESLIAHLTPFTSRLRIYRPPQTHNTDPRESENRPNFPDYALEPHHSDDHILSRVDRRAHSVNRGSEDDLVPLRGSQNVRHPAQVRAT